ncbi:MAG: putative histidine kinase, partial [Candidatus Saccharibacteria bacterium]|nr:putative histidine kinase [Candidatus Saccharibacteria bacterium]
MHIKSAWSYLNKELLAILSFLVISTIAALMYLTYTLVGLHTLTTHGSRAVGTAFVLQDLLASVQDVQNSTRGYIISGDQKHLANYTAAVERVPPNINLLRDNPDLLIEDSQVKHLESLVERELGHMRSAVDARTNQGFESAQAILLDGEREGYMMQLRTAITSISSFGLKNIGPMQERSEANLRRALGVAVAMSLLILATCVAIIWYFRHAILHERALESTKNEFLSLASHQLRTPATNVKQYIGLLLDGYMGDLNDQQRQALTVAYKNNESEITIMNNLLDVAKLDLNRIQLHKKITNVMKIVKNVVRDSRRRAKEHGHNLCIKGPDQMMASVD